MLPATNANNSSSGRRKKSPITSGISLSENEWVSRRNCRWTTRISARPYATATTHQGRRNGAASASSERIEPTNNVSAISVSITLRPHTRDGPATALAIVALASRMRFEGAAKTGMGTGIAARACGTQSSMRSSECPSMVSDSVRPVEARQAHGRDVLCLAVVACESRSILHDIFGGRRIARDQEYERWARLRKPVGRTWVVRPGTGNVPAVPFGAAPVVRSAYGRDLEAGGNVERRSPSARSGPVGVGNPDSRSDSPGTIGRCCPSSTSSSASSSVSSLAPDSLVEPTDPRTSRSSFSAISSGCCSERRAHPSSGPSTGSSSRRRVGSSRVTAGGLPRHPGDPPPLASRARAEEVDLAQDRSPWPTDRCRDP